MSAHTPGPWTLTPFVEEWNNASGERSGWHLNGRDAAFLWTLYLRPHRAAEDAANARLIAAAPQLCDALLKTRRFVLSAITPNIWGIPNFDPTEHVIVRMIDAALAAAGATREIEAAQAGLRG